MWIGTAIGLGACALVGCFEPQIRDGQIACELDTACPEGFVCIDGLCRNTAPSGKEDDPLDSNDSPDDDDDGDTPTAGLARIYTIDGGAVTSAVAADVLAGSAVNPEAIQTGFALCDGDAAARCWADAQTVACDFGQGFVDAAWRDLGGDRLAALSPTFGAAMTFDGIQWEYYFHRGPAWQGYEGSRLEGGAGISASLARFADSGDNADDLDTIYAGDGNAPSSFNEIVWDYVEIDAEQAPWHFVDTTGRRFTIRTDGSSSSDSEPHLEINGAPDDDDVTAASMCNGALQLYAID